MPGRLSDVGGWPSIEAVGIRVKSLILHITLLQGPIAMERNPLIR